VTVPLATIVPLRDTADDLDESLPFDLVYGLSVQHMGPVLKLIDLRIWNRYVAEEQQRKITEADVCITHEYLVRTVMIPGPNTRSGC
jgi:hypothetical protein